MDLSIEGNIFINGTFEKCCLGIENGKIKSIKKILKADQHINYKNKLILPSGIDLHVHFRDPGMTQKEDFYTGSLAAAYGGISCIYDMPNTIPHTSDVLTITDKIKNAEKKSIIDFGIYSAITNNNIEIIEKISEYCNGFKIFLGNTTLSLLFDKNKLKDAFEKISKTGKPVFFHAEDEECLIKNKAIEKNLADHLHHRPAICEEISIKNIINSSKNSSLKIHICHVSSCEGLEILKNRPMNISCGITPHHSLISIDKNLGTLSLYKVNPPIRTSFDRESLFNAYKNGTVDIIESDHAPHTLDEKAEDFNEAPSGLPGVETTYPLFLYLVKKEIISFQRLISLLCNRPSEIMGIPKGKIETGYDADFIVIDLKNHSRIKSDNLHSKCGWTPYEDWPAIFPETVYLRGKKIIEEKEIQVKKGNGNFIGA